MGRTFAVLTRFPAEFQPGTNLTFVNEKGDKCRGVLKAHSEVIALDWEGGLTGVLTDGATRINWKNGKMLLEEQGNFSITNEVTWTSKNTISDRRRYQHRECAASI